MENNSQVDQVNLPKLSLPKGEASENFLKPAHKPLKTIRFLMNTEGFKKEYIGGIWI